MSPQFRLHTLLTTLAFALVTVPAFAKDAGNPFDEAGCEAPSYDQRTLLDEVQGQAKFSFLIGKDGVVVDAKLIASSGFRKIDKESMRALKACRFPASAAPAWSSVVFDWTLK